MRNIKEYKLWEVTQAMIDGLINQSKRDDFQIKMHTFGNSDGLVCFGCAATCTIQQLSNFNFKHPFEINNVSRRYETIDNKSLFKDIKELNTFEMAIDNFRTSFPEDICYFLNLDYQKIKEIIQSVNPLPLSTNNWQERLPTYQELTNKLKELDI
jgi:hypothetical protein